MGETTIVVHLGFVWRLPVLLSRLHVHGYLVFLETPTQPASNALAHDCRQPSSVVKWLVERTLVPRLFE